MARLEAARTGRSSEPLPEQPVLLWRARAPGGIEHPFVVDPTGSLTVATTSLQLLQLDAAGKLAWSHRLDSAPATGPALTSDGRRVVLTRSGQLTWIEPNGRVSRNERVTRQPIQSAAPLLPRQDGGLLLGFDRRILRLDASGALRTTSVLDAPVRGLLGDRSRAVVITRGGDILIWAPPHSTRPVGRLEGRVDGAAMSADGHLVAIVDNTEIVDFDFDTATQSVRFSTSRFTILGPLTLLPDGSTRVTTVGGLLLGHDRQGRETVRVSLDPTVQAKPRPLHPMMQAPGVIVDGYSRVGFARPGQGFGIVARDGRVARADEAACARPVAVLPAGPQRMAVACRSGLVWMLGADRSAGQPTETEH